MNCEQQANADYARNPLVARGESKLPVIGACSLYAQRSTLNALRASSDAERSTLHSPGRSAPAEPGAPRASAFSLVEVTLALMVMAIGILSIMSLFPAGLDQNARSIADTHAAFFAEEVFGGLQAYAETNWAELDKAQLPVAASNMWSNMGTNRVHVTGTNVVMNKYEYYTSGVNTYEDHALRYRLVVTNVVGNVLLKAATLWVWPGEFGTTNDPSMFYAEFFRWKPL